MVTRYLLFDQHRIKPVIETDPAYLNQWITNPTTTQLAIDDWHTMAYNLKHMRQISYYGCYFDGLQNEWVLISESWSHQLLTTNQIFNTIIQQLGLSPMIQAKTYVVFEPTTLKLLQSQI